MGRLFWVSRVTSAITTVLARETRGSQRRSKGGGEGGNMLMGASIKVTGFKETERGYRQVLAAGKVKGQSPPSASRRTSFSNTLCMLSRFSHVRLCDTMDCSPLGSSAHGDSPGKNPGVGRDTLLQGIFLTHRSNLHLLCLLP